MYPWLDDALSQSDIVITASRRLSRELCRSYNDQQLADGKLAWPTPDIRFVGDWIKTLYDGIEPNESTPLRIDAQSSSVLWERCVRENLSDDLPGFSGVDSFGSIQSKPF